jgi:hypothetical protein
VRCLRNEHPGGLPVVEHTLRVGRVPHQTLAIGPERRVACDELGPTRAVPFPSLRSAVAVTEEHPALSCGIPRHRHRGVRATDQSLRPGRTVP